MLPRARSVFCRWTLACALGWTGCGPETTTRPQDRTKQDKPAAEPLSHCPDAPVPATSLPGTGPEHETAAHWLSNEKSTNDALLVTASDIEGMTERDEDLRGAWRDPSSRAGADPAQVVQGIEERLAYLERQVALLLFVQGDAGGLASARGVVTNSSAVDHQRLVLRETQLWCAPFSTGLYKSPVDPAFDRNACASLHPGERVRVQRRGAKGRWLYVNAGHTVGWLQLDKGTQPNLSERLSLEDLETWQGARRLVPLDDSVQTSDGLPIRLGVSVPIVGETEAGEGYRVLVPAATGITQAVVPKSDRVHDGALAMTREAVFEVAFSQLGAGYGWGGTGGRRDCSRYLRDLFRTFGVELGRHSGVQAQQGARSIDVSALGEAQKRATIDSWAAKGVVMLYMPGHIMLYLGRDGDRQFAISSISEYATPCSGGPDTVHRIDKVAVGTLELGRGAERRSFIERITTLAVFAPGLMAASPEEDDIEAAAPSTPERTSP